MSLDAIEPLSYNENVPDVIVIERGVSLSCFRRINVRHLNN